MPYSGTELFSSIDEEKSKSQFATIQWKTLANILGIKITNKMKNKSQLISKMREFMVEKNINLDNLNDINFDEKQKLKNKVIQGTGSPNIKWNHSIESISPTSPISVINENNDNNNNDNNTNNTSSKSNYANNRKLIQQTSINIKVKRVEWNQSEQKKKLYELESNARKTAESTKEHTRINEEEALNACQTFQNQMKEIKQKQKEKDKKHDEIKRLQNIMSEKNLLIDDMIRIQELQNKREFEEKSEILNLSDLTNSTIKLSLTQSISESESNLNSEIDALMRTKDLTKDNSELNSKSNAHWIDVEQKLVDGM